MMNEGWSPDCAFCVGSKFTCDEHHFLHQGHPPEALALVAELLVKLSSLEAENLLYAFDEGRKFAFSGRLPKGENAEGG